MNKKGTPANLRAAHPGNTNALKSGVYSPRVQAERTSEIKHSMELSPLREVLNDMELEDLAGLRTLRESLDDDLATFGVTNRKGEIRRAAELRLSVSRRIEKMSERISRHACTQPEDGPDFAETPAEPADRTPAEPADSDERFELYVALKELAFDRHAPPSVQIKALIELLESDPPRRSRPEKDMTEDEFQAFRESELIRLFAEPDDGDQAILRPRPEPEHSEVTPSTDDDGAFKDHCLRELHDIATGKRSKVRAAARLEAYRALRKRLPPVHDLAERKSVEMDEVTLVIETLEIWPPFAWSEVNAVLEAHGKRNRYALLARGSLPRLIRASEVTAEDELSTESDSQGLYMSELFDLDAMERQLRAYEERRRHRQELRGGETATP